MALEKTHEDAIYASVLADGKIHVSVPEGTEGAVLRKYETSDGKEGEKWEHIYDQLSGRIKKVDFREGDFGTQLLVTVGDDSDEKPVVLALGTASNYGEDLMKKLLGINPDQDVTLKPYSFNDDKGKLRKGISVTQGEAKILNYFYDADKKKNLHNYPVAPKAKSKAKPVSKDEWKIYFTQCRIFLIDKVSVHYGLTAPEDEDAKADKELADI